MLILGQWVISLLLSHSCPTPTAWVTVATIVAVCGDEDGTPVLNARNRWALPWNMGATKAEFEQSNSEAYDRARKVLTP